MSAFGILGRFCTTCILPMRGFGILEQQFHIVLEKGDIYNDQLVVLDDFFI